jgi:hypothetical protein
MNLYIGCPEGVRKMLEHGCIGLDIIIKIRENKTY